MREPGEKGSNSGALIDCAGAAVEHIYRSALSEPTDQVAADGPMVAKLKRFMKHLCFDRCALMSPGTE